ncbi:MAG: segregation/condensation protein A [Nitrospiraceae bacterium]|nr:MAG: segregation/condensation protein A [Nitrospiraceae bacterium]
MPEVLEETKTSQSEIQEVVDSPQKDSEKSPSESINPLHFKLPVFEGPLDLLLHLIKDSKIDIYDIPIVDITQQYLGYIELMKELNLEIAGEFLVMAATLIHIKSKMLLPPAEEEKEEPVEDPRSELVRRLLEYQAYKDSSLLLRKRETVWKNIFNRTIPDVNDVDLGTEPVLIEAHVFDLISAFQKLLEKAPPEVLEITRETLTVADKINFIVERLENEDGVRFEDLFEEGYAKVTLIVTFLALLEIIRLGLAKIYQEKAFGVIWILNPQKNVDESAEDVQEEPAAEPPEVSP